MRPTPALRARTTLALLPLLLVAWVLQSLNAAAYAAGPLPNMSVTIFPTASYHKVCVHGDAVGIIYVWQLTIVGGGADGPIAPGFLPSTSATYDQCYWIFKGTADFGYVVTLTGGPVGGTTAPFVSEGVGAWLNGQDYFLNSG